MSQNAPSDSSPGGAAVAPVIRYIPSPSRPKAPAAAAASDGESPAATTTTTRDRVGSGGGAGKGLKRERQSTDSGPTSSPMKLMHRQVAPGAATTYSHFTNHQGGGGGGGNGSSHNPNAINPTTVTTPAPYNCAYCGKDFQREGYLRVHTKSRMRKGYCPKDQRRYRKPKPGKLVASLSPYDSSSSSPLVLPYNTYNSSSNNNNNEDDDCSNLSAATTASSGCGGDIYASGMTMSMAEQIAGALVGGSDGNYSNCPSWCSNEDSASWMMMQQQHQQQQQQINIPPVEAGGMDRDQRVFSAVSGERDVLTHVLSFSSY